MSFTQKNIIYDYATISVPDCVYVVYCVRRMQLRQYNFYDVHRLMRLFEGGVLSKITEEEYQKLNDKLMGSEKYDKMSVVVEPVLEGSEPRQEEDDKQLTIAMSMKTLQGAFYVLAIGSIFAGIYVLKFFLISIKYD